MMPGATARPDLSVVMINLNRLDYTTQALESIRAGTRAIDYEVVLIDNGSTRDASAAELPRRFPWARFIANDSNSGFGRASNQGIGASSGRFVLLLNNDTVVLGHALDEAVAYMDAHPDVAALGILHYNDDDPRTIQESAFRFPTPLLELLVAVGLARPPARPSDALLRTERDVDWICGSFWLMRREAIELVGLLDERFFAYDEDIDWCRRARDAGLRVRFWPGAAIVHRGGGARPFMRDKTFVHFRSRLSYLRKHHGAAMAALYYLGMTALLTSATIKETVRVLARRGTAASLQERWARQVAFMLLRVGGTGG
jgi:N-acetylglucosaminyl-diphospho-decaprenol L-rhamnosyltransferase